MAEALKFLVTALGIIFGGFYVLDKLIRPYSGPDAKVVDLTKKIDEKKQQLAGQEARAESSLEEYEKLKKDYDSNNSGNKPNS